MEKAEKRKYAQAVNRIATGVWGYPASIFRAIHLTTREGDDNSSDRFVADFRKLIVWFRKLGYMVEYCGAMGFTPQKGLIHYHGLLRIKGGYLPITRRQLGDKWNEIHNAFVVKMGKFDGKKDWQKYTTQHILKDYAVSSLIRNHFLVSRGWARNGCKEILSEVKKWYCEGINFPWMDKKGWSVANRVVRAYCEGKPLVVKADFGHLILDRRGHISSEIYSFNEEGVKV